MEEPRTTSTTNTHNSNSDTATQVTARLDGQAPGHTTTRLANDTAGDTATGSNGSSSETAKNPDTERMQFVVVEGFQVGRGAARIDPADMARLGCQAGDIIMIEGARTTAAKVVPSANIDRGQRSIQMDSQVRQNSASGLGEHVSVHKARVSTAEKITILPLSGGAPIQESDLQYITRYLVGLPVTIGDLLRVGTPGTAPREFLIIGTNPATPAYTLQSRKTGELPIVETPAQGNDVEAVMVQPGTIVRAQARGANNGASHHVGYEDIGGLGKELQRIREMLELPLKYPAVFDRLGVEPPKGVLLYGPPGTGKTLIARVVATETKATFFIINGPEIINKFYGESESRLRSVFQEAQRKAPSVIFIDEIDALAPKRAESGGEVERRIVGQLLALMDGLESRGQVVIIGATNQPNALDPAIRRPGRFDREIALRVPDMRGRMEILQIHSRDAALANDVDLQRLAQLTPGFVGADLEALCREAAMIALRRVLPYIDYQRGYIPYETLVNLNISMADFQAALREIEPSTTREVYVEVSDTSWDDIGGLEYTKNMLTESVEWPLRYPEIYSNARVEPPRGVILSGPPGSGKTLIARALANQCEASFISIKGPELLSKWVGESEKGIREVFRRAKQAAPCIVFFDELDALAPRRGGGNDGNVGDRVIAQLLTEMDGIEGREGVIVLAATNRPDMIDPALLRPGRFDLAVELQYPDEEERRAIFAVHLRGRPVAPEVTIEELARITPGRSGADIEAICRRAALFALREWIAPRLTVGQVSVVPVLEAPESNDTTTANETSTTTASQADDNTTTDSAGQEGQPATPPRRFSIRPEHFARAIDEQHERYSIQEAAEEERARQERGRQRLIDMAADYNSKEKPQPRGFRLWLARIFGLV
ncbi:CDC48 family AAA ATPase [Dictyobacter aurantiacus]|uniref:ATPase AAA n=1 Tax=Dictyobacter aurantiacus TaxID=1936993 RepID=A0A401ZHS9_9CHLR|nr:CDC48 family AAA ATPase [Dictyobacter aurantiacus]GCE06416.1 ATPase AAA [Dictyobacter aurantiacus]